MKNRLNKKSVMIIFSIVYVSIMVIAIGVDVLVMPSFAEAEEAEYDEAYDMYSPQEDGDYYDSDYDSDDYDDSDDSDNSDYDSISDDSYDSFDFEGTDTDWNDDYDNDSDDWGTEDFEDVNDETDESETTTEESVEDDSEEESSTDDLDDDIDDLGDDPDYDDDDDYEDDNEDTASNKTIDNVSANTIKGADNTNAASKGTSKDTSVGKFVVSIDGKHLNIRKKPTISEKVTGQLNNGETGIVVEKGDEWSLILSDSGKAGYVRNDMIVITQ